MTTFAPNLSSPIGLEFSQWGSAVAERLAAFGVAAPAGSADTWREWACGLFYVPQLAAGPTPMEYEIWSDWAERFVEVFS